jgi:hypothetical protein
VNRLGALSDHYRYEVFSFFRSSDTAGVWSTISSENNTEPRMVYLRAEDIVEAAELVRTAAYQYQKTGKPVRVLTLRLAGGEPQNQITDVIEQLAGQLTEKEPKLWSYLRSTKIKVPLGIVSLPDMTVGNLLDTLNESRPADGPLERPTNILKATLLSIAEHELTVLLVNDSPLLNDVVRESFYAVMRLCNRFSLVLCCPRGYEPQGHLLSPDFTTLDLELLDPQELWSMFAAAPDTPRRSRMLPTTSRRTSFLASSWSGCTGLPWVTRWNCKGYF